MHLCGDETLGVSQALRLRTVRRRGSRKVNAETVFSTGRSFSRRCCFYFPAPFFLLLTEPVHPESSSKRSKFARTKAAIQSARGEDGARPRRARAAPAPRRRRREIRLITLYARLSAKCVRDYFRELRIIPANGLGLSRRGGFINLPCENPR